MEHIGRCLGTSSFAAARGARNDEIHVVVIDGKGKSPEMPEQFLRSI